MRVECTYKNKNSSGEVLHAERQNCLDIILNRALIEITLSCIPSKNNSYMVYENKFVVFLNWLKPESNGCSAGQLYVVPLNPQEKGYQIKVGFLAIKLNQVSVNTTILHS